MPKSYIGITDFTTYGETVAAQEDFRRCGGTTSGRLLHVGVMMSRKTLKGLPSKWSKIFPKNRDIANIFVKDEHTLNVLHYADYDGVDVAKNLAKATEWGYSEMDALQLDMIWPDPAVIKNYRLDYPDKKIILQINSKSLAIVDHDPDKLLERLNLYGKSVGYVLLDMSMGRGIGLNTDQLLPYLTTLDEKRPDLGLAVAGGLCAQNLSLLEPIIEQIPNISIDAQSKLRPSGNAFDPIDWGMARAYLEGAVKMFLRHYDGAPELHCQIPEKKKT